MELMISGPGFSAALCDVTQKAREIIFVECYQCVGCTTDVARKKPIWCEILNRSAGNNVMTVVGCAHVSCCSDDCSHNQHS